MLCYLVACYPTCGSNKPGPLPSVVLRWFSDGGGDGEKARDIDSRSYPLPIHQSFGTPMRTLMESLHVFFRDRGFPSYKVEQIPGPEKDYTEFLKNISSAIDALDNPRSSSTAFESRCSTPRPLSSILQTLKPAPRLTRVLHVRWMIQLLIVSLCRCHHWPDRIR